MAEQTEQKDTTVTKKRLEGVVVSDKTEDTVVVNVEQYVPHPKYGKYIRKRKRYVAHDPGNTKKVGDKVTIELCRPISKKKRFAGASALMG